jgi:hypothetical protein
MQAEGGAAGFVDIVARLLSATFGGAAAPIAAAVAGEIVTSLTEAGKSDAHPPAQTPPSPLRGGVRGGGKPTSIRDDVGTNSGEERSSPFPFPGPT